VHLFAIDIDINHAYNLLNQITIFVFQPACWVSIIPLKYLVLSKFDERKGQRTNL